MRSATSTYGGTLVAPGRAGVVPTGASARGAATEEEEEEKEYADLGSASSSLPSPSPSPSPLQDATALAKKLDFGRGHKAGTGAGADAGAGAGIPGSGRPGQLVSLGSAWQHDRSLGHSSESSQSASSVGAGAEGCRRMEQEEEGTPGRQEGPAAEAAAGPAWDCSGGGDISIEEVLLDPQAFTRSPSGHFLLLCHTPHHQALDEGNVRSENGHLPEGEVGPEVEGGGANIERGSGEEGAGDYGTFSLYSKWPGAPGSSGEPRQLPRARQVSVHESAIKELMQLLLEEQALIRGLRIKERESSAARQKLSAECDGLRSELREAEARAESVEEELASLKATPSIPDLQKRFAEVERKHREEEGRSMALSQQLLSMSQDVQALSGNARELQQQVEREYRLREEAEEEARRAASLLTSLQASQGGTLPTSPATGKPPLGREPGQALSVAAAAAGAGAEGFQGAEEDSLRLAGQLAASEAARKASRENVASLQKKVHELETKLLTRSHGDEKHVHGKVACQLAFLASLQAVFVLFVSLNALRPLWSTGEPLPT
eukprot:jgi/Mesen1/6303/ME000325S05446